MTAGITIETKQFGKFKSGAALKAAVESTVGPALKRAGMKLMAAEMAATPVKSGNLRRGWAVSAPEWDGMEIFVKVGNAVVYAQRVNATSKRAKGFVQKAREQSRTEVMQLVKEGLAELKQHVWEKE